MSNFSAFCAYVAETINRKNGTSDLKCLYVIDFGSIQGLAIVNGENTLILRLFDDIFLEGEHLAHYSEQGIGGAVGFVLEFADRQLAKFDVSGGERLADGRGRDQDNILTAGLN